MKTCSICKTLKPLSEFTKDKRNKSGLKSGCRPCCAKAFKKWRAAHPESRREEQRLWGLENPEKVKVYGVRVRLKRYKISLQEYERMKVEQEGKCAVCGARWGEKTPAIDHCHSTGKIRGLLCASCNTGLGAFKDCPNLLANAIEYLCRSK